MPALLASTRRPEKRLAVRYPCEREVLCRSRDSTMKLIRGRVRNLSTGGIGIVVPQHVKRDAALIVSVAGQAGEGVVHELPVRVVHARPMPICGWFLGCKFAQQLELGEVKALA